MNVERGFRRITWAISVVLLLVGVGLVMLNGWNRLERWNRAIKPVSGAKLYAYQDAQDQHFLIFFERGESETVIKQALDGVAGLKDLGVLDFSDPPPPEIAFIYFEAGREEMSSALYNREAVLRAEARGRLSQKLETVLAEVRSKYRFPAPVSMPFTFWEWIGYASIGFGIAIIPWGIFFLFRWIILGFRSNSLQS